MSQSKRNDARATAATVTIALVGNVAPANDTRRPGSSGTEAAGVVSDEALRPERAAVRQGPLGLSPTYWVLWGGMLLNRLGGTIFMFLGIYLTRHRGFSAERAGLVITLDAAGGLLAGPIGGALADRFGRRATLLVGTVGAGTSMLLLARAFAPAAIFCLAPVLGFFTDLYRPPLQAAVADVVPPRDRTRAYGLLYWAGNLGFAVAAALGGALASHHFGVLFVVDALTTFAFGCIVFAGAPETRPRPSAPQRTPRGGSRALAIRTLAIPFRDRAFVRFALIQLPLLLAFAQVVVALPLDMQAHGLAPSSIGWLLGMNGLFVVVGQPLALRLFGRVARRRWLVGGAVMTGAGLASTALAGGTSSAYLGAIALWSAGEIGFSAATPAILADLAPRERRGLYQGTYQLAGGVATVVSPLLGSVVLGRCGGRVLWVGCGIACLLAAGLHLRFTVNAPDQQP